MPGPDPRPPARVFINGRFLTQAVTGVQRYAREVVRALDALAGERVIDPARSELIVLAPYTGRQEQPLPLAQIAVRRAGRLTGHAWEQLELPVLSRGGVLLNLCNSAPLVRRRQTVTLHDAAIYRWPDAYTAAFRLYYRSLWAGLALGVPGFLTVSEFSRRELGACLGLRADAIRVVSEAGEHVLRTPADTGILDRHGLRARAFVFAVSTANPTKNFAVVGRAAALLGDAGFDIVLAGGADPRIFAGGAVPMPPALKHVGYVSDAELRALYEHALCFVHPSLYEGFGLPPLEAMACGCPVIAADAASLPEVCGDAALYFDPRSPEALAGALRRLAGDRGLRDQLARRGRAHAARFSWRQAALENWDALCRLGEEAALAGSPASRV